MDHERTVYNHGTVAIEDGLIVDVGSSTELAKRHKAEKTIDATNMAVLPGFVNTHTHLFQTLLRSLGDDLKLMDWLPIIVFSDVDRLCAEDCYYGAVTGCLELIRSGCTCTVDNHVSTDISLSNHCIQGLDDVGIRAVFSLLALDCDVFEMGIRPSVLMNTEKALKETDALIRKWHGKGDGRLHVWPGAGSPFSASKEFLIKGYQLSKKYKVGFCTHLHETQDEVRNWTANFGMTPIKYCKEELGILDSNLLAAHCVWLSDEDIQLLKENNVKVSHNPVSNMYLASGVAPIPKLLRAGVTVGLGVDGAASNNNQDMFEVIKTTALLQKVATLDPVAITAEKVLEMATIDGARTLGLEKEIGSIEKGKKADIILVNLKKANMTPINRVVSQLVYCARASNVNTVIIDGKLVMENREIKSVNEEEILMRTQEATDRLVERAEVAHLRKRPWISKP